MTQVEFADAIAAELAARNADIPFGTILHIEQNTWPPGGPKIDPCQTADVWFQLRLVTSMTADEWDVAVDPEFMLIRIRFLISIEALTQFACACCRRIWDLIPGDDIQRIVEATEETLQGNLANEERELLFDVLDQDRMERLAGPARSAAEAVQELFEMGFYAAAGASLAAAEAFSEGLEREAERKAQAELLRKMIGNPLRKVP